MNKIQHQMQVIQNHVDHHQKLPSLTEIADACQVAIYHARGIQRRYMIYRFTCQYLQIHGHSPSRREVSQMLHIPLSVIQYHLDKLLHANVLAGMPNQQRAIRISE